MLNSHVHYINLFATIKNLYLLSSLFVFSGLCKVVNGRADGGITALHLAALNGHPESVQLLLDLGACVSEVTVNDGATIDLIGVQSLSCLVDFLVHVSSYIYFLFHCLIVCE